MTAPNSINNQRMATNPIVAPRTMRHQTARALTSLPAGKMVPIAAFPLLREDTLRSGRIRQSFELNETAEILMNAVNVHVRAYLVPMLALERFNGSMDQLNLSYEGKPPLEGEAVVPYIETQAFGAHETNKVYQYLGLHGRTDQLVNTAYLEAYNAIWNFRAKNRSPKLTLRTRLQTDLAPAFWSHDRFRHIVPNFDQAAIDGEVALNVVNSQLPVRGINIKAGEVAGNSLAVAYGQKAAFDIPTGTPQWSDPDLIMIRAQSAAAASDTNRPQVFAEMAANGITVSLSNIELAKKTQAFARMREQYNQHDDWIINLLMDAITIPDQFYKQPMLLAERKTIFGMAKRYASDAGNLTESVVNGATFLDLSIQTPRIGVGGIVMIVAEITPDQLFERQEDPFLAANSVNDLPQFLRDYLDPEKVDVVKNGRIDVDHATPNATFGYEPLNARWNIDAPRIGGRFYRPEVNAGFDEDRQRIWAVETVNPTLGPDFYLCTNIHTKPFAVTTGDVAECVTQGELFIEGNTVFGGHLIEATDDYEKVMAEAPQDRIVQTP